jgi:SAM-dependent methyltransferase
MIGPSEPTISESLRAHVEEHPFVRRSIFSAVRDFASELAHGTSVLDAGAGEAPYAELFSHCEYVTADWPNSVHVGARIADISASLESLPVSDNSFGAVVCTEVLEHVARPSAVLAELGRVLQPGGRLCMTVPFVWPLHEEPFDFYRYTPHALEEMLGDAGFVEVRLEPRTGYLTTLAQVAAMTQWMYPRKPSGFRGVQLRLCLRLARYSARPLIWLASRAPSLEHEMTGVPLPLGYVGWASKP